jgi:hypothetical protein
MRGRRTDMLKTAAFWAGVALFSLLYFLLTANGNPALVVLWAAVSGFLAVAFLHFASAAENDVSRLGVASLLVVFAVVIGTALKVFVLGGGSAAWDSAGVALAAATAWGGELLRGTALGPVCFLCRTPVGTGQSFTCPRCDQTICVRPTCWNARHLRCSSCLDRGVVLFTKPERWWHEQLGARVNRGTCDSCFEEAGETDLRACGQCPLLMCRRCWDHHNGCCTRCGWRVADLPEGLAVLAGARRPREAVRPYAEAKRRTR